MYYLSAPGNGLERGDSRAGQDLLDEATHSLQQGRVGLTRQNYRLTLHQQLHVRCCLFSLMGK